MPTDLSRSLLTILIPGLVAVAPWVLFLLQHSQATFGLDKFPTVAHAFLFAIVVVAGTICEGFGTTVESQMDVNRKSKYDVFGDWYAYLASLESPVGHRYLSRLVTSMYFELGMFLAFPIFLTGAALLCVLRFSQSSFLILVLYVLSVTVFCWWFLWLANGTHLALCHTRAELRKSQNGGVVPARKGSRRTKPVRPLRKAYVLGLKMTLYLVAASMMAAAAGMKSLSQALLWQHYIIQPQIPLGHFGDLWDPSQVTPANALGLMMSLLLGATLYSVIALAVIQLARRRKQRAK